MPILKRIESAIIKLDTTLNRTVGLMLYVLFFAISWRFM